jgi:aerobic-type carbon monoxide dehydrogenase small subunit (CoxS/CutS family)
MALVTLNVNGAPSEVDIDPSTPLLYVLRNDLGLRGPRFGCGLAQCGACTVIIDGAATRSCVLPASAVSGEITTLEGLSQDGRLDPLQQAWIAEQVPQCGYCQNGQIMTARAMLDANPNPTDAEIRAGMEGVLCRCMTYYRIQAAIKRAVRETAAASFKEGGDNRGVAGGRTVAGDRAVAASDRAVGATEAATRSASTTGARS